MLWFAHHNGVILALPTSNILHYSPKVNLLYQKPRINPELPALYSGVSIATTKTVENFHPAIIPFGLKSV